MKNNKIHQSQSSTNLCHNFILNCICKLWNNIPNEVVDDPRLNACKITWLNTGAIRPCATIMSLT